MLEIFLNSFLKIYQTNFPQVTSSWKTKKTGTEKKSFIQNQN